MRKFFLIFYLCAIALALAVIPAGMYVLSLPLWAAGVIAVLPVGAAALWAIFTPPSAEKRKREIAAHIIREAVAILVAAICFLGSFCNPYFGSYVFREWPSSLSGDTVLTYSQAEGDLAELENILLRIHPRFLSEPDALEAELNEAREKLAADGSITVNDLHRAAQIAVSALSDAHTTIYAAVPDIRYRLDYAELAKNGYEVVSVNGTPIDEFFRQNSHLFSYETESWGMYLLLNDLYSTDGLEFLELDADGYTLTFSDGTNEVTRIYTDADFVTNEEYFEKNAEYYADRDESFVTYEIDRENSLALLTLEECVCNDEYCETLKKMFTEIKERGIQNVAVDLRGNGGGSSTVINEFIRYLDVDEYKEPGMKWRLGSFMPDFPPPATKNEKISELTFYGNVYLLADESTFSSAMMFAEYFKDNSIGTIIGAAPGNAAYGYGDITWFRLPNSGLMLQCSTKSFVRPDMNNPDLYVEPDIPCDPEQAVEVLKKTLRES